MASPFVGNPGPAFDPRQAAEHAAAAGEQPMGELHALPDPIVEWGEPQVKTFLTAKGRLLHGAIGVGEQDWAYTEADLQAIAPPLTRILNRYDATRAAAGSADPVLVAIGFGGYAVRSWRERRDVLAAWAEQGPQPITGHRAPEGTGPEPEPATDADWQGASVAPVQPAPIEPEEAEDLPWTT